MNISQYYRENKAKYGAGKAMIKVVQHAVQRIIGADDYEVQLMRQREEIDTLFYLLNNYLDMSQLETKDEALRILQECDSIFLAIFDKVCRANGLNYWMAWGTLLGAVRHKGFIPWDDDTDVCMLREDFDRAAVILPRIMGDLGIEVRFDNTPLSNIGLGYMHNKTGIWIDVFVVEPHKKEAGETNDMLANRISKFRSVCKDKINQNATSSELSALKKKMLPGVCSYNEADILVYSNNYRSVFFEKELILPIKRAQFEDVELSVPNESDLVLRVMYGDEYMKLPRTGVEHHGGDQGKLSQWAKNNNIDMYEIKQKLMDIYNSVK